jgi:hypothetical protein
MANYFGNRSAIILECPHCKKQGDHHTRITEPLLYSFQDVAEFAVKSRLGHNFGYRVRIKDCKHCGKEFRTVEMPAPCLDAIIGALEEALVTNHKDSRRLRRLEQAITKIQEALVPLNPPKAK